MYDSAMRAAAVAGSWYPGDEQVLCRAVDEHLASVEDAPRGDIVGLVAPHAGLVYSGAVAAYAYQAVAGRTYDVVVLVGPSHHVGFEGVAVYPRGWFATPLGDVPVSADIADRLLAMPWVRTHPTAHVREHSLEMQLPFLQRVLPSVPIVPLLLGAQEREVIRALGDALAAALADVSPLIVASTDLSHYFPASQAEVHDRIVIDHVARFDAEGLLAEYERYPADRRGRCVACGGGALVAVMRAVARLGAEEARVLRYADSGDVSGDKGAVVGCLAAALGRFVGTPRVSGQTEV